jgi:MYXO-CTERM domain-containing protein
VPAGGEPHAASGGGPGARAFLPLALAALVLLLFLRRRR